jgi:hypothetical protein
VIYVVWTAVLFKVASRGQVYKEFGLKAIGNVAFSDGHVQ